MNLEIVLRKMEYLLLLHCRHFLVVHMWNSSRSAANCPSCACSVCMYNAINSVNYCDSFGFLQMFKARMQDGLLIFLYQQLFWSGVPVFLSYSGLCVCLPGILSFFSSIFPPCLFFFFFFHKGWDGDWAGK